ncbi:MAG: hypothetical protein ACE37N_02855, partial [Pseudohongiellaceae bacterium]
MTNHLNSFTTSSGAARRVCKLLALLVGVYLSTFAAIPDAQAACPAPPPAFAAVGLVDLVSCTEQKVQNDDFIQVAVPSGVIAGDLLVTVIARDDDNGLNVPGGWNTQDTEIMDNNDGFLGVYYRIATGTEAANYTWDWGGNEDAYAYMLRFTNASGQLLSDTDSGNGGVATALPVTTTVPNTLDVRVAGWDR